MINGSGMATQSGNSQPNGDNPKQPLQDLQDITNKIRGFNEATDKIKDAVTNVNMLQGGDPAKKLQAMYGLYESVISLIPGTTFDVFMSELNTLLPFINEQLGVIQSGLQLRDNQYRDISSSGRYPCADPATAGKRSAGSMKFPLPWLPR